MWYIDKQFPFCYSHRVWSQQLEAEYCEHGDVNTKCRHLHGHEGLVHIYLEASVLERGMVTDFKHLGWLKDFFDKYLDHKFIIDLNDPLFSKITHGNLDLNFYEFYTNDKKVLPLTPVYIYNTKYIVGYTLNVDALDEIEQELYGSFFIVNFVPTSENL